MTIFTPLSKDILLSRMITTVLLYGVIIGASSLPQTQSQYLQGTGPEQQLKFHLTHNAQISVTSYHLHSYRNATSATGCAVICAKIEGCLSFYFLQSFMEMWTLYYYRQNDDPVTPEPVIGSADSSKEVLDCLILTTKLKLEATQVTAGPGVYGRIDEILKLDKGRNSVGQSPPQISNAHLLYMTRTFLGPAAVYKCSTTGTSTLQTFGWAYDYEYWMWPQFTGEEQVCVDTLCETNPAATGSLLTKMSFVYGDVILELRVSCEEDEHWGTCRNMVCDANGEWRLTSDDYPEMTCTVPCRSQHCYRQENNVSTANYAGVTAISQSGLLCHYWDTVAEELGFNNSDVSPDDTSSLFAIWDYCRDLRGWGHPACYVTAGQDGFLTREPCDIALCQYSP